VNAAEDAVRPRRSEKNNTNHFKKYGGQAGMRDAEIPDPQNRLVRSAP
jgi:hypothetical protein